MNLYLARHGESELNAKHVHQFSHTPLSELGHRQAQFLAGRVESLPLDVVFSSPLTRALETAKIVLTNRENNHQSVPPLETTPLLAEIARPSVVQGKSAYDSEAQSIKALILEHYHDPTWRHSDEETFVLAKERAQACLEMLQNRSEKSILCVTHGMYLALLVSCMLFGPELTSQEYLAFVGHVYTKNTGLTWCSFRDGEWRLVTWNDHAHLAE